MGLLAYCMLRVVDITLFRLPSHRVHQMFYTFFVIAKMIFTVWLTLVRDEVLKST